jgi:hypothetical protein
MSNVNVAAHVGEMTCPRDLYFKDENGFDMTHRTRAEVGSSVQRMAFIQV